MGSDLRYPAGENGMLEECAKVIISSDVAVRWGLYCKAMKWHLLFVVHSVHLGNPKNNLCVC